MNITVNITAVEIEKIIREAAERQMPSHQATKVTFKVTSGYDDRFMSSSPTLTGVDVTMEPKVSTGMPEPKTVGRVHRGGMDDR